MAVVNVLPNGFLIVTLSPREAVLLNDQILEPEEFPWQSSEAQMIAMEVKSQIKTITEELHTRETKMINEVVHNIEEHERAQQQEQEILRQRAEELRRQAEEQMRKQQQKPPQE